jgi:cation transport ATPase
LLVIDLCPFVALSFNPVAVEKEIMQKKQKQTSESKSTNQSSEDTIQQKSTVESESPSQIDNKTEANEHKSNDQTQEKEASISLPGIQLLFLLLSLYFLQMIVDFTVQNMAFLSSFLTIFLLMECVLQFPISHLMLMCSLDVNSENLKKQ